jgi:hypothetical protein
VKTTQNNRGFHINLAATMWAVAVLAFGCAGPRYCTWKWAAATYSMVACAIFVSLIGAISSHRVTRAAWSGFAAFSVTYFVLVAVGSASHEHYLASTTLLQFCVEEWALLSRQTVPPDTPYQYLPDESHYMVVGQMMFAALCGIAGAMLAQYFYLRYQPSPLAVREANDNSA